MPRIPYQAKDLAEPKDIVDAIRSRRGGELLDLDRMLLHSPPLARGWNALLRHVRQELALPPKHRELAICAVARLNEAAYEFAQHAPEFLKAGGTKAQLAALDSALDALLTAGESGGDDAPFDVTERAVLRLTIEMTRRVKVSDEAFSAARTVLPDDRQLVELVGVIATYNLVSRFLVALEIEPD
jgi:alkylhydroperoxidase family enzyme